jgi:acyl carrier protein
MNTVVSEAQILDDLRSIFRDALAVETVSPIGPQTLFFGDLGLASIDVVVLGEAIQQHFGQVLPFDRLLADLGRRAQRDLEIGELIAFLQSHLRTSTRLETAPSTGTGTCLESRPTA